MDLFKLYSEASRKLTNFDKLGIDFFTNISSDVNKSACDLF